jgi:hypothetical protein
MEIIRSQLRRDVAEEILGNLRYEEIIRDTDDTADGDASDSDVTPTVNPPVIDLLTGNYLRPVPNNPAWIWRNPMCTSFAVYEDRFNTLAKLSDTEVRQQVAGRVSVLHAHGGVGYETRRNTRVQCQPLESFTREPGVLESFFPNFDFSGLPSLPYHFLVQHGSEPYGSMVLPTGFPFTFPRVPLPDDTTTSGVRRGSLGESVREMLMGRNVDPVFVGTDGNIQVKPILVYKHHDGRSLPLGNAGDGWSVSKLVVGMGNMSWELKVVLPPNKPIVCLIGASHVDRMCQLNLNLLDQMEDSPPNSTHPHHLLWSSTAFVVTKGDFDSFNTAKGEIFAFFFSKVKEKFVGKINPTDHLRMVLSPFTWDILALPVERQVWNLVETSRFLTEIKRGTDYMQISHVYSEVPLLHNDQDYSVRTNIVVREVNNLINSTHVPIRIWYLRMAPLTCERAKVRITIAGWNRRLKLVTEADRTHLAQSGYFEWICEVWNRAILELNPPELSQLAWRDFDPVNLFVMPNLGPYTSFFDELVNADVKAREDRTDILAASRLSLMQSIRVDLTRLDRAYRPRAPRIRT